MFVDVFCRNLSKVSLSLSFTADDIDLYVCVYILSYDVLFYCVTLRKRIVVCRAREFFSEISFESLSLSL